MDLTEYKQQIRTIKMMLLQIEEGAFSEGKIFSSEKSAKDQAREVNMAFDQLLRQLGDEKVTSSDKQPDKKPKVSGTTYFFG